MVLGFLIVLVLILLAALLIMALYYRSSSPQAARWLGLTALVMFVVCVGLFIAQDNRRDSEPLEHAAASDMARRDSAREDSTQDQERLRKGAWVQIKGEVRGKLLGAPVLYPVLDDCVVL